MIVTVFSVCEKFLGFLYRVYLSRTIGPEGMGVYQVALSVFALLFTITCSGTPITVSRLMTKYRQQKRFDRASKVVTAGLAFTVFIALPITIGFYLFKGGFSVIFTDRRSSKVFYVVLPALVFTSVYSVLRGVFWGNKDFLSYSAIELLEELCMIVVGVVLIERATDLFSGILGAGIAVLISYLFSFTLASIVFFVRKNKLTNPKTEFRPLLSSALPVTAMRTANSLVSSLVSVVLPIRLIASGLSSGQAMSAYGAMLGQAMPLLSIPSTLIGSFILVLVPTLSENYYSNNHENLKTDIEKAIGFTLTVSCLFVPVFTVCGEEIGMLIFGNAESGKYLTASAFLMIFMGTSSITSSVLNSIGLENKTLIYFIIATVFMLLAVIVLPPFIGIYSIVFGFALVYLITTVLNLTLLNKSVKSKPEYLKNSAITILSVLPPTAFGYLIENLLIGYLGNFFTLVSCMFLIFGFHLLTNLLFGTMSISDLKKLFPSIKKRKLVN